MKPINNYGPTYVAVRTDGRDGVGTESDPRDGSSPEKLDAIIQEGTRNKKIILLPGQFYTNGTWNNGRGGYNHVGIQLEANSTLMGYKNLTSITATEKVKNVVRGYYDLVESVPTASNVTVEGITLNAEWGKYFTSGAKCGCIRLRGANCRIAHCEALNWGGDASKRRESFPVFIMNTGIIENCFVHSPIAGGNNSNVYASAVGIGFDGAIRNNIIRGTRSNLYSGFGIMASTGTRELVDVYGNIITDWYEGVHGDSWGGNLFRIRDNTFSGCRRAISLQYTNAGEKLGIAIIENNLITLRAKDSHGAATAVVFGNKYNGPSGTVTFRGNIMQSPNQVNIVNAGYAFGWLKDLRVSQNIWGKGVSTKHNTVFQPCETVDIDDETFLFKS